MIQSDEIKPPVLILGGAQNALSIARSLGRRGIKIYISTFKAENALHTKYCTQSFPIPDKNKIDDFWRDLLLGSQQQLFQGCMILTGSDDGVEFVAKHRQELEKRFILEETIPEIQLAMLDKKNTLKMAKAIGIQIPNYWEIETKDDLEIIESDIKFPVIIKPIHSHLFQKAFNDRKYFRVENSAELHLYMNQVFEHQIKVMISEFIPGPDSLLWYYSTYLTRDGEPLFHFTKNILRRFPKNEGLSCYQKSTWNDEVAELGLRFFKGINFRGLGNIEFKRDLRDGHLKVIECNARFIAPEELFVQAGVDVASIIYNHLVGLPTPKINSYNQNLGFWYPVRDYRAYKQLREFNEITFWSWIKSLRGKNVLPYFQWSDPMPTVKTFFINVRNYFQKKLSKKS